MQVKNFLFHRVSEEKDKLWPPMRPDLFDKILSFLCKEYTIVRLEDFLTESTDYKSSKQIATILFDDGYKDNIEYAVPILRKNNCAASFYIVTDCIDRNLPTWTFLTDHALQQTNISRLELSFSYVPEELRRIQLKENSSQNLLVSRIKPWMKTLSNQNRLEVLQSILYQCSDVPLPENKMMNWNDIRELNEHGFYVGSHSHTHPMLGRLENEEEINDELEISSNRIRQELGTAPFTISYPIGSFDERVRKLAQKNGYKYGLAVEQRFYSSERDSLFAIPRVELYQEPLWKVRMRVSGIYTRLKRLWR
jgi:peptidoglycan/xylan/chitin deacetylase (PgdA/CDA1 family)